MNLTPDHLSQLIAIESGVHYGQPPPPGVRPYVVVRRRSPVLLSAPHGARTFRNNRKQTWHEEDEYTAGMALLLADLCGASVIATLWRTDDSDPNYSLEENSEYKRTLRRLVESGAVRWVIDLHGAGDDSPHLEANCLVDLGTRKEKASLPEDRLKVLTAALEGRLGLGTVGRDGYPAYAEGRTVTAFCHGILGIAAVQVELKPAVRVPFRRTDASRFARSGPYAAAPGQVLGVMQGLLEFIATL